MKRTALICMTALTITLTVGVMISDLFLRPQDIPGVNPEAWDVVGSLALVITFALCTLVVLLEEDD